MERPIDLGSSVDLFINGKRFCCCTGIEVAITPLEQKQVKICFDADKVVWNGDRVDIYDEDFGACLSQEEGQMLNSISTKELVDALGKREGVERKIAEPHEDVQISVNGPAIVLVITD